MASWAMPANLQPAPSTRDIERGERRKERGGGGGMQHVDDYNGMRCALGREGAF
jgi:hypothetical protein